MLMLILAVLKGLSHLAIAVSTTTLGVKFAERVLL